MLQAQLDREFFGNSLRMWIIALAIFVLANLILLLAKRNVHRRTSQMADVLGSDGWTALRDLTAATKRWFLFVFSFYLGAYALTLPGKFRDTLQTLTVLALLLQAGLWGGVLLRVGLERWARYRVRKDPAGAMMLTVVGYLGRLVLWSLIVVLMLENLGVQVTALVAGLGIGGAAVALASQSILSDLFASLSIVVDQPFLLGDFLVVGDIQGTVEQIGMKTVRLRSLSGEQLIVSNHDLLQSRIRNFQRMEQRRVLFNFTVHPDASTDKLASLPGVVREIIEAQKSVRFERAHLQAFGDFGVRYEVVYHVLTADFNLYMDVQQAINLAMMRRMDELDLHIAYQKGLLPPDAPELATDGDEPETK